MKISDTKSKILEVASHLFAINGFNGTSVREIAKDADVNTAAINYHFNNKENLYQNVFMNNYKWIENGINQIAEEKELRADEFALKIFELFLNNKSAILTSMRMILRPENDMPKGDYLDDFNLFGPPGWRSFMDVIAREVDDSVPLAARFYVMSMTFSSIIHLATILSTEFVCSKTADHPFFTPEQKGVDVKMLINALIDQIKKDSGPWKGIDFEFPTEE